MANPEITETVNQGILTTTDRSAYIYSKIQPFFKDVVVAIIILLIGLIVGKILGKVVQKLLNSLELDKLIRKATGMRIRLEEFLGKTTSFLIFFVAIIMALDVLNLTSFILYIIVIVIMIIIIFSVAISIKDFIPNIIAGLYLQKKKLYKEGDSVKIHGQTGKVMQITLTETKIHTKNGDLIYIPNSLLTKGEVVKKSKK